MPQRLTEFVARLHGRGTPVMFFPFVAWSRAKRLYSAFDEICPVELLEAAAMSAPGYLEQILSDYRRGDFSWLLDFDAFAENRYVEYDPGDAEPPFKEGIESRFGLSHSFEYLRPTPSAKMVWKDTGGNPFVVVGESSSGKSCYVNTCCHACMSPIAVSSPLEVCPEFGLVLRNCLRWLME